MKTLNLFFLAAFLLSALAQFNDPDPVRWILLYGAMAISCALHHFGRLHWLALAAQVTACLVWMGSLVPALNQGVPWPEVFGSLTMQNDTVEEVREIGGLLFVLLWASVLLKANLTSKEQSSQDEHE